MSDDPSDLFIDAVQPKVCRVISLPTRLWVFGGPVPADSHAPSESLRASFWRLTLDTTDHWSWLESLDRPEDYPDWWAFAGYDDLLEFERDACYLARGILLFAESPGSYAELGALALDTAILPRLMVVIDSQYLAEDRRQSFLYLGPLKRVNKHDGQCVIDPASSLTITDGDFGTIMQFVDEKLPRVAASSTLDAANPMHRLLLLADLVDMFLVSGLSELEHALLYLDVPMTARQIRQALKLLDFFHMVKICPRGNELFAVRRKSAQGPWISMATSATLKATTALSLLHWFGVKPSYSRPWSPMTMPSWSRRFAPPSTARSSRSGALPPWSPPVPRRHPPAIDGGGGQGCYSSVGGDMCELAGCLNEIYLCARKLVNTGTVIPTRDAISLLNS